MTHELPQQPMETANQQKVDDVTPVLLKKQEPARFDAWARRQSLRTMPMRELDLIWQQGPGLGLIWKLRDSYSRDEYIEDILFWEAKQGL